MAARHHTKKRIVLQDRAAKWNGKGALQRVEMMPKIEKKFHDPARNNLPKHLSCNLPTVAELLRGTHRSTRC